MRRVLFIFLLCVGVLVPAAAATGQAPPPTLTGESLTSLTGATITGGACDGTGASTMTFEISGVAAGPYPGTFTETGTVTLGPPLEPVLPGQFSGPITSFQAHFTITSATGTVVGDKVLVPNSPANTGQCVGSSALIETEQVIASDLTYTATITTAEGTFSDRGTTFANFNAFQPPPPTAGSPEFREVFTSELVTPEPVGPQPAATVVLTPPTALNPVGSDHTVTATATTATGAPAAGVTIRFTVTGASSTGGSCTTDQQGQCTFTYTGPALPGADLITGCADNNANGAADTGEPCGDATKIWMLPATTPGQVTGGGWIDEPGDEVSFGFTAQSPGVSTPARGECNVIDHATMRQLKCLTVDTLVVTPTHATFFGRATIDDAPTNYRIDVDDLGEPALGDTFKIETENGYVAAGTLQGGDIQIHM